MSVYKLYKPQSHQSVSITRLPSPEEGPHPRDVLRLPMRQPHTLGDVNIFSRLNMIFKVQFWIPIQFV